MEFRRATDTLKAHCMCCQVLTPRVVAWRMGGEDEWASLTTKRVHLCDDCCAAWLDDLGECVTE